MGLDNAGADVLEPLGAFVGTWALGFAPEVLRTESERRRGVAGAGLDRIYLEFGSAPLAVSQQAYRDGGYADHLWKVGVMGEGLDVLPGGAC